MSGANSQFVLHLELDENALDPRVAIHRATQDLKPGTMVRLVVGNARPVTFAVPFFTGFDLAWFRNDLVWQVVATDPTRLIEWEQVITELGELK